MKKIWTSFSKWEMPDKSFYPVLIIIAAVAMLALTYMFYIGEPLLARDAVQYVELMKYYEHHGKLPMVWYISSLPFIIFRLAGMLPGSSIVTGMFLGNCLSFGLAIVLFGLLARKILKNNEMALACALIYSLWPKIFEVNVSLLRESCAMTFALATLFFFVCALDSGKKWYFFATAFCGFCAVFSRIEFFELQSIIGFTMITMWCVKKWKFMDFFRNALSYFCGIVCALLMIAVLLGGTWEEYKNIPDIIIFRCRASSDVLESNSHVPDYYYY